MTDSNISMGKQAAQDGNLEQAANYLAAAVQYDPENEEAWVLFGDYLTDLHKRHFCYQRALELNPGNEVARARLDALNEMPTAPVNTPEKLAFAESPTLVLPEAQEEPTGEAEEQFAEPAGLASQEEEPLPVTDQPTNVEPVDKEPEKQQVAEPAPAASFETPVGRPEEITAERHEEPSEADQTISTQPHPAFTNPEPRLEEQPEERTETAQSWTTMFPTAFSEPEQQPEEAPSVATPVPARAKTLRPRPMQKKSPFRFLLFIFPLMLLALVGLLMAYLLRLIS